MSEARRRRASSKRRIRDLRRALDAVRKEARSLEVQLRRETRESTDRERSQVA